MSKNAQSYLILFAILFSLVKITDHCCSAKHEGSLLWKCAECNRPSISTPLCVNENMVIVKRICKPNKTYEWWCNNNCKTTLTRFYLDSINPACENESYRDCCNEMEPGNCFYIQSDNPCPENFIYLNESNVCYTVQKTKGNPSSLSCPYEETISFTSSTDFTCANESILPLWMPAGRDHKYGYFVWKEPSSIYGAYVAKDKIFFNDNAIGKDCLLFHNDSYYEAVYCNETRNVLCVYETLNTSRDTFCSKTHHDCTQSDFSTKSVCFCETNKVVEDNNYQMARFFFNHQNSLKYFWNKDCAIGLERKEDNFFWTSHDEYIPLNYSYWSMQAAEDQDMKEKTHGIFVENGWTLRETLVGLSCAIFEKEIGEDDSANVTLKFENNEFTVHVLKPENFKSLSKTDNTPETLVKCFTDASAISIVYRLRVSTSTDGLYRFSKHVQGPGNYWCEAFKYPDLKVVTSNTILLRERETFRGEYVAIIKHVYQVKNSNILNIVEETLLTILRLVLPEPFHPRIFNIEEVDVDRRVIIFNAHFTSNLTNGTLEEFYYIYNVSDTILNNNLYNMSIVGFYSVDACVEEVTYLTSVNLTWPTTEQREWPIYPNEGLCIKKDAKYLTRTCDGDFVGGRRWSKIGGDCKLYENSNLTEDLQSILDSDDIMEKMDLFVNITSESDQLSPTDIFIISKILEEALDQIDPHISSEVVNNINKVPRDVLENSQNLYGATDKILHAVDDILMRTNQSIIINTDHFAIIATDLKDLNMTGLILQNCSSHCIFIRVFDEVSIENLEWNKSIDAAVIFSPKLLHQLHSTEGFLPRIIINVFFSNNLFNEKNKTDMELSKIFGILLPDFGDTFDGPITILHRINKTKDSCAYWNYKVNENENDSIPGTWTRNEEQTTDLTRLLQCDYYHVTHFALLISNEEIFDDVNQYNVVELITTINCVLSLFGIFGIVLTGFLFQKWRRNTGNQILLNFVVAVAIQMGMLYLSDAVYKGEGVSKGLCVTVGAILHYSVLSEFCWMLIIAILQFKRFVEVLGGPPKYILLKACICGWIFPLFPVILLLIVDSGNYAKSNMALCYPTDLGLYLGVWLPIIIIFLINSVIFIYIMYNVCHKKSECIDSSNNDMLFEWRLALLLYFMLGLTWLFGFIAQINFAHAFVYLFSFTATLQGFVMFLFFILFNKNTRFLYTHGFMSWLRTKQL